MVTLYGIGRYTGNRLLPALAYRDYRYMWLGISAGDSASWAMVTARAWLALTLADQNASTWVGLTIFAAMIPYIIVVPFVGLLADRMIRRNLLAWTLVINLTQAVAMAVLALSGALELWHLVLLSFVSGSARAAQYTASYSMVANLVPKKDLINGYVLESVTFHASRLVGPGLIAPIMATIDPGWVFVLCSGLYIIGLYLTLQIRTVSTGVVEPSKGMIHNLLAGLRYTYSHRPLLLIMLLIFFHCSLTMSFESLLPVISDVRFDAGGNGVVYMMMAIGGGALVGSLWVGAIRGERLRGQLLLITGVFSALAPIVLAVAPSLPIGMLATATMGAFQAAFMVITAVIVQLMVPDAIRGRISSIYILHAGGIMAFANLGNGALADVFDPGWLLAIAGPTFLVVMAVSIIASTMRRIYITGATVRVGAEGY